MACRSKVTREDSEEVPCPLCPGAFSLVVFTLLSSVLCFLEGTYLTASLVAQPVRNPPAMQETQVPSRVGKIPWSREWQPTPIFLPGKSHGRRSLVRHSPWGHRESDTAERLSLTSFTRPGTTGKQGSPGERGVHMHSPMHRSGSNVRAQFHLGGKPLGK